MNDFTLEELQDLRLIYKIFCTEIYNPRENTARPLTDLEKSIISKLENLIKNRGE